MLASPVDNGSADERTAEGDSEYEGDNHRAVDRQDDRLANGRRAEQGGGDGDDVAVERWPGDCRPGVGSWDHRDSGGRR